MIVISSSIGLYRRRRVHPRLICDISSCTGLLFLKILHRVPFRERSPARLHAQAEGRKKGKAEYQRGFLSFCFPIIPRGDELMSCLRHGFRCGTVVEWTEKTDPGNFRAIFGTETESILTHDVALKSLPRQPHWSERPGEVFSMGTLWTLVVVVRVL